MRKEIGLILAGAVAFNLGTVVVPAQGADANYLKIDGRDMESVAFNFQKFDVGDASAANRCVAGKGTLVEFKGDKYCRTNKTGTSTTLPATAAPSPQRK
jgi:hypothetical protein